MTMNSDLTIFQWGKETTPGTPVPATSKILVEDMVFSDADNTVWRPRLRRGTTVRNQGNEMPIKRGVRWSVPDSVLSFEQMMPWLSMGVKGGVTSVGPTPFTWTYTRAMTGDPALNAFTFERRLTDASTPKDLEIPYNLATKLGWKGARDQMVMFNAEGMGRTPTVTTITAALSYPTVEMPTSYLSKLYIDDSWANLGTTLVSSQIIGWNIDFGTGVIPFSTLDGRTALDFATHKYNGSEVTLDVEISCLVGAQYVLEKAAAVAQSLRAVRIQIDGSGGRQIQFDMMLKHEPSDILEVGEEDGQVVCAMKLVDSGDDGTNLFRVKVVNLVETMI